LNGTAFNYASYCPLNKSIKIFFNWFLGPAILLWLGFNLYREIAGEPGREASWRRIEEAFTGSRSWQIYMAVLLVSFNWGIEALKWRYLVRPIQKLSFFTALKGVLAGTSLAVNTPNQVGEYFGRMIYIEEGNRLRSISLTIAGSFSQLIITLAAGTAALYFFIPLVSSAPETGLSVFWIKTLLSIVALGTALALLVYFKLSWLVKLVERLPRINRYTYFFTALETLTAKTLCVALLFSAMRYAVFMAQYLLVMDAFGINNGILLNICLVSVLFVVMSAIPTIVLAEAGIRSKAGEVIFGVVYTSTLAIVTTGLFIWLINLMLPALLGGLMLLGKKIFKK
jgi:Lysylphosphatidylglycerol synthase TM region